MLKANCSRLPRYSLTPMRLSANLASSVSQHSFMVRKFLISFLRTAGTTSLNWRSSETGSIWPSTASRQSRRKPGYSRLSPPNSGSLTGANFWTCRTPPPAGRLRLGSFPLATSRRWPITLRRGVHSDRRSLAYAW